MIIYIQTYKVDIGKANMQKPTPFETWAYCPNNEVGTVTPNSIVSWDPYYSYCVSFIIVAMPFKSVVPFDSYQAYELNML